MAGTKHRAFGVGRVGAAALIVIALGAAGACSSSTGTEATGATPTSSTEEPSSGTSAPATSSPGTSKPEGTTAPTTTEVEPSPEAVAATLTAADLGAGWADYPEDAPVYGTESSSCTNATGLLDGLPDESIGDSAIIQYGDRLVFATTSARVFATPTEAQAYGAHLMSDAFIECRRAQLESYLPESETPETVVSLGSTFGDGSSDYVGSYAYEDQQVIDGVAQNVGSSRHAIYVKGNTVVGLFTQVGALEGDPPDLATTTNDMINAGMDIVLSRVAE